MGAGKGFITKIILIIFTFQLCGIQTISPISASDLGAIKDWETSSEEYISLIPTVSDDGLVYGINDDFWGGADNALMCIENGKIKWSSKEKFDSFGVSWQPIIINNYVVAMNMTLMGSNNITVICYTLDGKKMWQKEIKPQKTYPFFERRGNNLLVYCDEKITFIDAESGSEIKTIDLNSISTNKAPDIKQTRKEGLDYNTIKVLNNKIVIGKKNHLRCFDIDENNNLKEAWSEVFRFEDDFSDITYLNLLLWMQSTDSWILAAKNDNLLECYSTEDGLKKFSIEFDTLYDRQIVYNEKHIVYDSRESLVLFSFKNEEKLWEIDNPYGKILSLDDKYLYIQKNDIYIYNIENGEKLSSIAERDIEKTLIKNDNIYMAKKHSFAKYSLCNPCKCKIETFWEKTKNDTINLEVCPFEEEQANFVLKNDNPSAIVECSLKSSSDHVILSEISVTLNPENEKTIMVRYCAKKDEPDISTEEITVTTNCNQEIKLAIQTTRKTDCKEKLKKIWETEGFNFHLFGSNLVNIKSDLKALDKTIESVNFKTGKQAWSLKLSQVAPKNMPIEDVIMHGVNLVLRLKAEGKDDLWVSIDTKNGKLKWKRNGGEPWAEDEYLSNENRVVTYFSLDTGKTLCSSVKVPDYAYVTPVFIKNGKYFLKFDCSEDELKETVCYDAKGKILWKTKRFYLDYLGQGKCKNLYLTDINISDDFQKEETKQHKLVRIDPVTGKVLWSFEIIGIPEAINESDTMLYFFDTYGIYCLNNKDGSVIWQEKSHKIILSADILNGFIIYRNSNGDDKAGGIDLYVLDPKNGKALFKKEFNWYVRWSTENNNLFINDLQYDDQGQFVDVFCIDMKKWELIWKATGRGEARVIGQKTIFISENYLSWFFDGKPLGNAELEECTSGEDRFENDVPKWFGNSIFIKNGSYLQSIDASTGKTKWKLRKTGWLNMQKIIETRKRGAFNIPIGELKTPCVIDGIIFNSEGKNLVCYKETD
ncbi:MAG: PQQ-binding-like beta-propeller repeat protein [Caldisericia bacterium]|jgi:outer membrane protein assembly factor BamB|nr:PQQ-binding-like beta-propeller repeat protein [Caldisericia bacterium]